MNPLRSAAPAPRPGRRDDIDIVAARKDRDERESSADERLILKIREKIVAAVLGPDSDAPAEHGAGTARSVRRAMLPRRAAGDCT